MPAKSAHPPLSLLIVIAMASPLALNIFVPAMPLAAEDLGVSKAAIQLSFTLYLFTLALGQLFSGLLADFFGRRPLLLLGFALHLAGSLMAFFAGNLTFLLAGRVLQALGGSTGMALARSVLLDTYGAKEAASRMGYLIMAIAISQAIAPAIGGFVALWFDWNSVFIFSIAVGAGVWATAFYFLPETTQVSGKKLSLASAWQGYKRVLSKAEYLGYVMTTSFLALAFYLFVGSAPYLVVENLGGTPADFGLWFLTISGSFIVGGYVSTHLGKHLTNDQTINYGNSLAFIGASFLLTFALIGTLNYWVVFLPMALTVFARGLSQPNAQLAAINTAEASATASGMMGFIQLLLGGLVAQSVPQLLTWGYLWVVVAIFINVCLAAVAHQLAKHFSRKTHDASIN